MNLLCKDIHIPLYFVSFWFMTCKTNNIPVSLSRYFVQMLKKRRKFPLIGHFVDFNLKIPHQ